MRSADNIAITSRVEASNAGGFSHSLESVSEFITDSARQIKTESMTIYKKSINYEEPYVESDRII